MNIEFQSTAKMADAAQKLAWFFKAANEKYATDYPAAVGPHMTNTDSTPFMDLVPAISLRENERGAQIGGGWDPHWHQVTDVFSTFSDKDFRLGLNAAQTTLAAVAQLTGATRRPRNSELRQDAELVERFVELARVAIDAKRTRSDQFFLAVSARQDADAEHPGAAGGEEIPHRVSHDEAVMDGHAHALLTGEEEIRFGLGALHVAALDHDGVGRNARAPRATRIDLGPAARRRDAVGHVERLAASQAAPRRQEAGADEAAAYERSRRAGPAAAWRARHQRLSRLARDRAREEAAAHADASMHAPAVDR